ncbi:KTSC domain-containing protein [Rhizobium cremeum]|uniref:KTSC domain-containing protein n=1 Tax=Rhizobium cremeum TaxID=2813827 RepID=UPI0013AE9427|nr:KTSC domain-containing protein [Rhizobium cremeum]MCJ7997845.1 KTSC domain-containing protein [Rhizobium cremeum]MCJ8001974.1 KTSC domain-containing protein [Rhizobium cremeum]MCJ8002917.1 KTSC domain-containing protein [Rhizobium cremeum]
MEKTEVKSRLIASASYDDRSHLLYIQLRTGETKSLVAPRSMYENLINADSPGWYYTRHISPLAKG